MREEELGFDIDCRLEKRLQWAVALSTTIQRRKVFYLALLCIYFNDVQTTNVNLNRKVLQCRNVLSRVNLSKYDGSDHVYVGKSILCLDLQ